MNSAPSYPNYQPAPCPLLSINAAWSPLWAAAACALDIASRLLRAGPVVMDSSNMTATPPTNRAIFSGRNNDATMVINEKTAADIVRIKSFFLPPRNTSPGK